MAKVKFVNTVKYKGTYHPAHSPFEADDSDVEVLVQKGAIIIVPPEEDKAFDDEQDSEEPVDKMTVNELKAYAKKHNIDISGAERKADILATIKAAESSEE